MFVQNRLTVALGGLLLSSAGLLSCDSGESSATLVVLNCFGYQDTASCTGGEGTWVSGLTLTGDGSYDNLLHEDLAPGAMLEIDVPIDPGTYSWQVRFTAGLPDHYDCPVEVELYPGRNTLKLVESAPAL